MDLDEAIRSRRSIRKFQDREVPLELVTKAIDLATWAPSASNLQPWRLFVVKDRATIEAMADVVQAKADQIVGWAEAAEFGEAAKAFQKGAVIFRTAPVVIGVAIAQSQNLADKILAKRVEVDPEAQSIVEDRAGVNIRAQVAASFTAHLLLELHSLGLGAVWTAGPMMARQELERVLGVPEGMDLFTLVTAGYPAETPAPPARKPVEEVLRVIQRSVQPAGRTSCLTKKLSVVRLGR